MATFNANQPTNRPTTLVVSFFAFSTIICVCDVILFFSSFFFVFSYNFHFVVCTATTTIHYYYCRLTDWLANWWTTGRWTAWTNSTLLVVTTYFTTTASMVVWNFGLLFSRIFPKTRSFTRDPSIKQTKKKLRRDLKTIHHPIRKRINSRKLIPIGGGGGGKN